MENNWYEKYIAALEADNTFHRTARSAKNAAAETIGKTVDWTGPSYLSAFAGALFGCLTLTAETTYMVGHIKWIFGIALILASLAVTFFAIRKNMQNEKRLRREITLLYYAYFLQYQVIKDAAYNSRTADLKNCKETIDNLRSDVRSIHPSEEIADESADFLEKFFRV